MAARCTESKTRAPARCGSTTTSGWRRNKADGEMEPITRRGLLTGVAMAAAQAGPLPADADPLAWTLMEASAALAKKTISSQELTRACFARIAAVDKKLNAVITLDEAGALQQAKASDDRRRSG